MPKQIIDLKAVKPAHTFMCYGPSRAGKTWFAATFPDPIFFSDKSERGWSTIARMDPSLFYGKQPEVWALADNNEMLEALREVEDAAFKGKSPYKTLVIDSWTFYADTYFAALELSAFQGAAPGKRPDGRQLYGDIGSHIRYLSIRINNLALAPSPLNVVFLCLAAEPEESGKAGLPALPGKKIAEKAPARCDFLFYHRALRLGDSTRYEVHTQPFGPFMAGGRVGSKPLPNPMEASYRAFEKAYYGEPK